MDSLCASAVEAALKSNWEEAVKINSKILTLEPQDIATLNRLGFAYLNIGKTKEAKKIFNKILKLDPANPIAQKNLKRVEIKTAGNNSLTISPLVFLEEPGITKTVNLININQKKVISSLQCGEEIDIITKRKRIELRSKNNLYVGALPDDMSFKIKKLTKLGNVYKVYVKSISDTLLTVIIREVKRGKRVKDPTFNNKNKVDYHASIRSEILEGLLEEEPHSEDGSGVSGRNDSEEEEV